VGHENRKGKGSVQDASSMSSNVSNARAPVYFDTCLKCTLRVSLVVDSDGRALPIVSQVSNSCMCLRPALAHEWSLAQKEGRVRRVERKALG
jgi:hypothetical protein